MKWKDIKDAGTVRFLGEFTTPRKGKMTISRTSIPDLIGKLIDRYIEEKKLDYDLVRLSRAKVMEIAVLQFLDQKGVLDKFLIEQGYPDARVKRIKQYLQSVS